jgi:TetR/AcrR family transcriptional regulator, fatty acid metabolism regulator protein
MAKQKNWDPDLKKKQIIEAAIKVLNKDFYNRAPVDVIAKAAGVAKGTIYLYFKSKEEIYFSVLFALMDKIKNIINEVQKTDQTATKQMFLLLNKMTEFTSRYRQIFNAIRNETRPLKDKFHDMLHAKLNELNDAMSAIVKKGIKDGEFKDYPPALISGIFFSSASLITHQQIEGDKLHPPIQPEMLFKILLKGFSA